MIFAFSLIPATVLAIVGYFVLYASTRAEGAIRRFGQYLGGWILFLAGASVLYGLLASTFGIQGPMGGMFGGIGDHMERMENMEREQTEILRGLQDR